MATVFFKGSAELATLTNTFDVDGLPSDPTAITLTVTDPNGTATTYTYGLGELTRTSQGVYTKDIACTTDGLWTYTWTGTGAAADVQAGSWTVVSTNLNQLYCSVEELKSRLGITGTADDLELHQACFTASRWLEQYCERAFWRTATGTVRTFTPTGLYCLDLPEYCDLVSISSLKTDPGGDGTFEITWASTDYQLLPVNPAAAPEQLPYTQILAVGTLTFPTMFSGVPLRRDRIQVTGVWGWPAVPMPIRQAALVLAAETFRGKDAPLGVAGFGDLGLIRVRSNPQVMRWANPYCRTARRDDGHPIMVR